MCVPPEHRTEAVRPCQTLLGTAQTAFCTQHGAMLGSSTWFSKVGSGKRYYFQSHRDRVEKNPIAPVIENVFGCICKSNYAVF